MSKPNLTVIWTPQDLRDAVTALRALAEPQRAETAAVIDIKTRERLA